MEIKIVTVEGTHGTRFSVFIDGKDVSNVVRSFKASGGVGDASRVTLEFIGVELEQEQEMENE